MTTQTENVDRVTVRELFLFATNDGDLRRQRIEPILDNLGRKMRKGTYDPEKAPIAWKYAADDAAQRYTRQHCARADVWYEVFPPDVRRAVAHEMADYYVCEVQDRAANG